MSRTRAMSGLTAFVAALTFTAIAGVWTGTSHGGPPQAPPVVAQAVVRAGLPELAIPADAPALGSSNQWVAVTPRADGLPSMWRVTVGKSGLFAQGQHVTISAKGPQPTIAGLYGPSPAKITGSVGVLSSTAGGPPTLHHINSRNVKAGSYVLVLFGQNPDGTYGAPAPGTVVYLNLGGWRIW